MNGYIFKGKNGSTYHVFPLTKSFVNQNVKTIKILLADILGAESDDEFITNTQYCGRSFRNKWDLSYVCTDSEGKVIAVLIAYFRLSDDLNPFDSVYVHRIAVQKEHRCNHIALNLMKTAISGYFDLLPWLNNITVQVTIDPLNIEATKLYKRLGFSNFGVRSYPHKTDTILVLRRSACLEELRHVVRLFPGKKGFSHPRFVQQANITEAPVFYISSSSKKKRLQLSWILSHYNLKTVYYSPPIDLVEPQLDLVDQDSEILLVSHPLKQISRFIKNDKTPFFVEDTMLFIERFNKNYNTESELPGMDTKRWWRQLGNEGVLELLGNSSKRRARYVSQVGCYLGSGKYLYGRGELNGIIASKIQYTQESEQNFPRTNPLFFHKIFVPNGFQRTLGELNEQEFTMFDYRKKAIEDLLKKMLGENIRCPVQFSLPFGDEERG